jgi:hypothetical protein
MAIGASIRIHRIKNIIIFLPGKLKREMLKAAKVETISVNMVLIDAMIKLFGR